MKITEMLQREDFYQINKNTLDEYYSGQGKRSYLYIYPRLNAIVTRKPSKAVKEYLLTEYDVRGKAVKKLAVKSYVRMCLSSNGRMAAQSVELQNTATVDTLIYPCNRKYRIFDFDRQTVDVQIKFGFPTEQLEHEIEFRTRDNLPDFVPALVSYTALGYKERIINGKPLARITYGFEQYKKSAYLALLTYANPFNHIVSGKEYAEKLNKGIHADVISCSTLVDNLNSIISKIPEILLTFSHGDLQAGNIWVENGTNKVYIIDWESWGMRSSFYDKAVLFGGLRPGDISAYLDNELPVEEKAVVLLEDLTFQLAEYRSLPGDFGKNKLEQYIKKVTEWSSCLV